jgi:hypothetical protein
MCAQAGVLSVATNIDICMIESLVFDEGYGMGFMGFIQELDV